MHLARYAEIKRHIVQMIEDGVWPVGERVPSENQLSEQFQVSRMTARRALQELTDEGLLVRSQGLGTFVAEPRPTSNLLEVRNIADEIAARGHRYSNRILRLEAVPASEAVAIALNLPRGSEVFHSLIVHLDNQIPLQLEDRYVNPLVAPEYLQQDFSQQTPNAYLMKVAPITEASHLVEAVLPDMETARLLELTQPEACLQIKRRSWSSRGVVSYVRLVHPGSRYRLGSHLDFTNRP
ncbi:MAG TPA: histidine utilization repressor [Candidatus Competibacteraceae bacterium]|nr:histidine utilization repressor [Candidatus Competibacteraceae bacterium]